MRWLVRIVAVVATLFALLVATFAWLDIPATGAGLAAKNACSGVFLAGRALDDVVAHDILPASGLLRLVDLKMDKDAHVVRATMLWSRERAAKLLPGLGCVLDPTPQLIRSAQGLESPPKTAGAAHPGTAASPPWPATTWEGIDRDVVRSIIDDAFRNDGDAAGRNTRAIVVLHRGRLVAERYGPGFDDATPQIGWSMSKSVLGMLVHARLADERKAPTLRAIDWVAPQKRPSWLSAWQEDGRDAITLADLLFMRDGLKHEEGYAPWSAVPRMLWGGGDIAAYAGSAPLDAPPGQRFRYLSATANLLSGLLRLRFESDAAYWAYPSTAVFAPIGARSALFEVDATGTFVASSYLWATPQDWARIGQFLLDDGRVDGTQVMPAGWRAYAGTPPPSDDPAALAYGAQVWLPGTPQDRTCGPESWLPADTLLMSGHWGQLTAVIPSRQAVIVRLGMTTDRTRFDRCGFMRSLADALPAPEHSATGQ